MRIEDVLFNLVFLKFCCCCNCSYCCCCSCCYCYCCCNSVIYDLVVTVIVVAIVIVVVVDVAIVACNNAAKYCSTVFESSEFERRLESESGSTGE